MAVAYTYPGVYVEESPSGVRTIARVSTSIAAFVGWPAQGTTSRATRVLSFQDFVRVFGGLDRRSLLGYAVQHFLANGGTDSYVVWLGAGNAATAAATIDGKLTVKASSPGAWSKDYRIETKRGSDDATRFRLSVIWAPAEQPAVTVESFEDLSIQETARRSVRSVVNAESAFIDVELVGAPAPPADTRASSFTTPGADGNVLEPNAAAFEAALTPPGKDRRRVPTGPGGPLQPAVRLRRDDVGRGSEAAGVRAGAARLLRRRRAQGRVARHHAGGAERDAPGRARAQFGAVLSVGEGGRSAPGEPDARVPALRLRRARVRAHRCDRGRVEGAGGELCLHEERAAVAMLLVLYLDPRSRSLLHSNSPGDGS